MDKKCKKCASKYDDTWGVCLFCGTELHKNKESRDICEEEGESYEQSVEFKKNIRFLVFIIILFVLIAVISFTLYSTGMDFWVNALEKLFWRLTNRA